MNTSLGVVPVQSVLPCESLLSLWVANVSDDPSHLFWFIMYSASEWFMGAQPHLALAVFQFKHRLCVCSPDSWAVRGSQQSWNEWPRAYSLMRTAFSYFTLLFLRGSVDFLDVLIPAAFGGNQEVSVHFSLHWFIYASYLRAFSFSILEHKLRHYH